MALSAEGKASVLGEIFSPLIRDEKFVRSNQQVFLEY